MSITRFRSCESEAARLDRHPQHLRLLAELGDRVDLAVVAEHRERLDALERGPGVGGVAVVAEAPDGLEPLVEQVGVVLAEDVRRTHHLVYARGRAERGDVDAELALELDHQLEDALGAGGVGDEAADLPEVGLLLAGGGARGPASSPCRGARRGSGSRRRPGPGGRRAGACRGPASARRRRGRRRSRRRGRATGLWPPARTSSAQILRGMSTRTPQPSPSPSTLPARCSIFWRFSSASATGAWLGVASLRTEA